LVNTYKITSVAALCGEGSFQPLADERSNPMFTRVVEINAKSGKVNELANTIHEKVLPILKKQAGFVDETVLTSDTEPNRIIGLSFWTSKEDAMRYHQEGYPKVNEMLLPLLEGAPAIRTFNVHTSTTHRIAAGKAA
jgi:quinol monooxygenase YgiN